MFKNYLTITIRNFIRQKISTSINILGLSIGLASAILIFLYIVDELEYDTIHPGYKNTYRIGTIFTNDDGNTRNVPSAPGLWGKELMQQLPDVLEVLRYVWFGYPTSINYREEDKILLTEEIF